MRNIQEKCIECAKIQDDEQHRVWKGQPKPDCYDAKKCARKRAYYRNHDWNKRMQNANHRYLKYKGDKCALCQDTNSLEVHHIMPQSKGGLDARFNVITLCTNCHKTITAYYSAIGWH